MKSVDQVASDIVGLLERLDVPYALMGGFAVRLYALPRPTFDVDFTIVLPRSELPRLYQAAEELGLSVPAPQAGGWVDEVRGLPVVKLQWFIGARAIDVDMFLAETTFQQELMRRRLRAGAGDFEAWFVTAEDLILLKLLAARPKDQIDVSDVLFVQGDLDEDYLRIWATRLGVNQELEKALKERTLP